MEKRKPRLGGHVGDIKGFEKAEDIDQSSATDTHSGSDQAAAHGVSHKEAHRKTVRPNKAAIETSEHQAAVETKAAAGNSDGVCDNRAGSDHATIVQKETVPGRCRAKGHEV